MFEQSQLTFDELIENPEVILNTPPESIMVKIDGKMVPWPAALPQLLSTTFFKRPIPSAVQEKLITQYTKKDDASGESVQIQRSNSVTSTSSKEGANRKGYSWFPWRRSQNPGEVGTGESQQQEPQSAEDQLSVAAEAVTLDSPTSVSPKISPDSSESNNNGFQPKMSIKESSSSSDESEGTGGQPEVRRSSRTSTPQPISSSPRPVPPPLNIAAALVSEKFKKSLRLTSDQIVSSDYTL